MASFWEFGEIPLQLPGVTGQNPGILGKIPGILPDLVRIASPVSSWRFFDHFWLIFEPGLAARDHIRPHFGSKMRPKMGLK